MGHLVLQGGAEFGGQMAKSDRRALALAGGTNAEVAIIPLAAVPDRNHHQAGSNGRQWFETIGAKKVTVLPLIDTRSAEDPTLVSALKASKLIYLLGGFPGYLARTLAGSAAWDAIRAAYKHDAIVAGSSAGAMVLCDLLYDPLQRKLIDGLALVTSCCIIPHHDTSGRKWVPALQKDLPEHTIIGIDEQTGIIDDGLKRRWNVYGRGTATIYRHDRIRRYKPGTPFELQ
jgi:cyanophycinase